MAEYSVSSKTNRVGMVLDGPQIKAYYDDMPAHQSVKEEPFKLRDGTPIVLLNDHYTLGSYPQIGTIASYHLTKLAQNHKAQN